MYGIPEKKVRILIVEDDKLFRSTLSIFLNTNPCCEIIGEAEDGQKGVNLAKELNPDIVLMDLGLPVMNGIEATKKIHAINSNIRVIILTSHSKEEEAMDALDAGAVSYVKKDIKLEHLAMIIYTVNKGAIWLDPIIASKVLAKCR